jgi:hypothetical protein
MRVANSPTHEVTMSLSGACSHRSARPRISRRFVRFARAFGLACLAGGALAGPAAAQWTRVSELPASDVFTVWANGDTIAAGADTAVYVSTDAGASWKRSARPAANVTMIRAVLVRDGRLYAGTFGQGVFVSDDLGTTWLGLSEGLAGPGVLVIVGLTMRGDSLYAATEGAGAWVRNLAAGPWTLFGDHTLQAFQATNMDQIVVGGSRLFAMGGFNGTVFFRDPGQPDWTVSLLFNDRFAPGLAGLNAIWTGSRWVVGSNIGMFHSPTGQEPWTYVDLGLHSLFFVGLAMRGTDVFASLGAGGGSLIAVSGDDGVTWQNLDTLVSVGVYRLAVHGSDLYAGRVDGLWRRSIATVPVPDDIAPVRLGFAVAGSQPIGDGVRFRIDLPAPGPIVLEFFDVAGRRAAGSIRGSWPAGSHEIRWDARGLAPGVYLARLTAGRERAVARMVRTR